MPIGGRRLRRHVLHGRRRPGERSAPSDGHAHAVDEGTQPGGRSAGRHQPALGRRARVPGGQENRHGVHTAHHVQRVAAGAARQEVHEAQRVGNVAEGVQRRVRRGGRPDRQQ